MYTEYRAHYRDAQGEEETIIRNDGKTLRMHVRGVEFFGFMFDDFTPEEGTDIAALASFQFWHYALCNYTLRCEIPVRMMAQEQEAEATLHVRITLGAVNAQGKLTEETLHLRLDFAEHQYHSSGHSGWFEDELQDIQQALPEGVFLKACIHCAFSDYSPFGNGTFGCLACFRDNKAEYLAVKGKSDLFRVWNTLTEFVQETHLCPEFQRRQPGTGYRG